MRRLGYSPQCVHLSSNPTLKIICIFRFHISQNTQQRTPLCLACNQTGLLEKYPSPKGPNWRLTPLVCTLIVCRDFLSVPLDESLIFCQPAIGLIPSHLSRQDSSSPIGPRMHSCLSPAVRLFSKFPSFTPGWNFDIGARACLGKRFVSWLGYRVRSTDRKNNPDSPRLRYVHKI